MDDYSLSRDFNCQFQIEHEEDLSKINNIDDKINKAIETIVSWFMSCQDIYVMAENMRKGLDCPKDRKEARRLFGIAYKMAKALVEKGDKEAILVLARCEAKGYGTEKDLKQALIDYQKYEEFCANCKERKVDKALQSEINAVRKKDSDH